MPRICSSKFFDAVVGLYFVPAANQDTSRIIVTCYNNTPNTYTFDNVKVLPYPGNAF